MSEQHTVPSIDEVAVSTPIMTPSAQLPHDDVALTLEKVSITEQLSATPGAEQAAGELCESDQSNDEQEPTAKMAALRLRPSQPLQRDTPTLPAPIEQAELSKLDEHDDSDDVEPTAKMASLPKFTRPLPASSPPETHTQGDLAADAVSDHPFQPGDEALLTTLSESEEEAEVVITTEAPQQAAIAQCSEEHPRVAPGAQLSETDVDALALFAFPTLPSSPMPSAHPVHTLITDEKDTQDAQPNDLRRAESTATNEPGTLTPSDVPENAALSNSADEVTEATALTALIVLNDFSNLYYSEVDVYSIDVFPYSDYKKEAVAEDVLPETLDASSENVQSETPIDKIDVTNEVIPIPSYLSDPIIRTVASKPSSQQEEIPAPIVPPIQAALRQNPLVAHWRMLVSCTLLLALLVNIALLLRDLTATHLYLSVLNAHGTIATQQDMGSYAHNTLLTLPISNASNAFLGVHADTPPGTQQVLTLTGGVTSWHVSGSFPAPLTAGSLTTTPGGQLLVESANGMQVMAANGQVLWQVQGPQPVRGAHPFQPASDNTSVYTVRSVVASQVAAYNLQNGKMRWTQALDDTLNYAPPFLLDGTTLYIASDARLYALNSTDGTLKWSFPYAARTLLLAKNGQHQVLLAAGVHGLIALDPTKGTQLWTFTGQMSNTLTPPQLYQAALAYQGAQHTPIVYTTGIVWQMPEVREQVWLYAVNAATGQPLWSQQLATGFTSADAGRTLMPLLDAGQVIVQEQVSANEQRTSAFNALTGTPTWQLVTSGSTRSAPAMLQTPGGNILAFTLITSGSTLLRIPSPARIGMLLLLVLCIIGLPLVWLLPPTQGQERMRSLQKRLLSTTQATLSIMQRSIQSIRQQRPSLGGILAVVLPLAACISMVTYTQLNQPQTSIYQANITTGSTLWHQVTPFSTQTLGVDSQDNMVVVSTAAHLHQLEVVNSNGTVLWRGFASEGTFALPAAPSPTGTLLVSLSGPTSLDYQYAPDDPSYTPALAHMLAFYRFERATGRILWQQIATYPDEQQSPVVLGADSNYIYITSLGTQSVASHTATLQLFAFNQSTGTVGWRIFGPTETAQAPRDNGTLLFRDGQVIWQVAGAVYAIDSTMGQIEWRHPLPQDAPAQLAQEEQQAVLTSNALLVMRSDGVHALDIASGNELWTLPTPTPAMGQTAGLGIIHHTLLVYSNGQLATYDLTDGHFLRLLWHQQQLGAIHSLDTAADGSAIYLATLNAGNTNAPSVIALDAQTGSVRWTLALPRQATFTPSFRFLYHQGSLVVGLCLTSNDSACATQQLLAVDTSVGAVAWCVDGQQIADVALSQDGTSIIYRLTRSQ